MGLLCLGHLMLLRKQKCPKHGNNLLHNLFALCGFGLCGKGVHGEMEKKLAFVKYDNLVHLSMCLFG